MAFSLGPNGQFRSASAPGVGLLPPHQMYPLPKCPTCGKVTALALHLVPKSKHFNICVCHKASGCSHNFLAQKVGGVSGCWVSRVEGTPGQWDTPCDRLEPLRIRWSLTLLGLTRSSFSIPGQSTWLEQC